MFSQSDLYLKFFGKHLPSKADLTRSDTKCVDIALDIMKILNQEVGG